LLRHFGSEENNSNECEQRAEKIPVIGNEHQVIIKNDFFKRNAFGGKGTELVLDVKYNKDHQDEGDGKEKS
jgi:hypothetical protein